MITLGVRLLSTFLLFWFLSYEGLAQNVIHGQVTDSQTGVGIPFASVFIQNSNKGTATDVEGNYRLENVPIGIHKVVFSYIGYSARVILVESLISGATDRINLKLEPQSLDLEELTVMASRPITWKRQVSEFERTFIGGELTQEKCVIVNKEVLLFKYTDQDQKILQAFAAEPLLIENRYLGYSLTVVLHEYEWDVNKNVGKYVISAQFDTLSTDKKREAKQWTRNRKTVYFGSDRHFFSLLYKEKGWGKFRIYDGKFTKLERSKIAELTAGDRLIHNLDLRVNKGFHLEGQARLQYEDRVSYLIPNKSYIFVDEYGNIFDPTSLTIAGEWATHRVSEMLPRDYFPR